MPNEYKRRPRRDDRTYRRKWRRATAVLTPLVALATVSALVLPAVTLSGKECPLEEHQHTADCYTIEAPSLACTYDSYGVHQHTEECYDETDTLICELPDFVVHTHDSNCHQDDVLVCELPEIKEHQHTRECYKPVPEAHQHSDACYEWIDAPCTLEETTGHSHENDCYAGDGTLLCTLEECAAHVHNETCGKVRGELICGKEETQPMVDTAEPELICGEAEIILHTHDDSCYIAESELDENTEGWILELVRRQREEEAESTEDSEAESETQPTEEPETEPTEEPEDREYLICTLPEIFEHQHEDACFEAAEPVLVCQIPEHIHTPECKEADPTEEGEERLPTVEEPKILTEEEKAAAAEVTAMMSALPTVEAMKGNMVTMTEVELIAYKAQVIVELEKVTEAYKALSEAQKELVLHGDKADELEIYLKVKTETAPEIETASELEFVADSYTTTVVASGDANLPMDTVITATHIYDSNEPAVAAFSLFALFAEEEEAPAEDGSIYADDIMAAVTWGEVTRIKLFDITLTSGGEEVQPSAPVKVRTEFAEPLMIGEGESVYGVHIGESGVEILPAEIERNEDGGIVAVTHTQSSFSPSGYVVLEHVTNEADIGPSILPVHYCIWLNDQWTVVGSTRTGWYGTYEIQGDKWTPDRTDPNGWDYITLEQIGSILGEYGLDIENHDQVKNTIWYQRAEESGITIYHDIDPVEKEIEGETKWVLPLSGNLLKDDGYHIYYVPDGTKTGATPSTTYESNKNLANDLAQTSKFYTMTVRDVTNAVYADDEAIPPVQTLRYGTPISVTVKANNNNKGKINRGWQWVDGQGNVVHGISRYVETDPNFDPENPVADERFGYEMGTDGTTETYSFVGIMGRTTLIPYAAAVDGAEQRTDKQVDIVVHLDGEWQKVGQLNLMYRHEDYCVKDGKPQWFITTGQIYTILNEFGFYPKDGGFDGMSQKFVHDHKLFDTTAEMVMYTDGVNSELPEAVAIGFSNEDNAENNGYTLFYLPGGLKTNDVARDGMSIQAYAEDEDLIAGSRFYSVKVADPYQLVYYGSETDDFNVYVREGEGVTVAVENADDVLWSVRGHNEFDLSQDDGKRFYVFANVQEPIVIEANSRDPSFTVQYYAEIDRYVTEYLKDNNDDNLPTGENPALPLIDTSARNPGDDPKTPKNSGTIQKRYIQLEENGTKTEQNCEEGVKTEEYKVITMSQNTEIYKPLNFKYSETLDWDEENEDVVDWDIIDRLRENKSYDITEIWVLKEGMDPESTNREDWWCYETGENGRNIKFTRLASDENMPKTEADVNQGLEEVTNQDDEIYTILLTEGMVIRLNYTLREEIDYKIENINFYDYDISAVEDGKHRTGQRGINIVHTGKTNTSNRYAFGNMNAFTGMGSAMWRNQYLNKFNTGKKSGNVYKGCTFELVVGLQGQDGNDIKWNTNIIAPNIFGEGDVDGRTDYTGALFFYRKGDVYTLTGFNLNVESTDDGTGKSRESSKPIRNNLQYLFNPSKEAGQISSDIFTNNFWVMDTVPGVDGLWGDAQNRGTVSGYNDKSVSVKDNVRPEYISSQKLTRSDDGNGHNWYFGMQFGLTFEVAEDYIGPLEYLFFGDDDMWVFLDGQLICDIGGVHSSVGEYVNLRDYLPVDDPETKGKHTLKFFYTERGGQGSTCWMSFTLPSVGSDMRTQGTSDIVIQKNMTDVNNEKVTYDEKFEFVLNLYSDSEHKNTYATEFNYSIGNKHYEGKTGEPLVKFAAGEEVVITGIPKNVYYEVIETKNLKYNAVVNTSPDQTVRGIIEGVGNSLSFANESDEMSEYVVNFFKTDKEGNAVTVKTIFNAQYNRIGMEKPELKTVSSGDTISLKKGEKVKILGIPVGTGYEIIEKTKTVVEGTITADVDSEKGSMSFTNESKEGCDFVVYFYDTDINGKEKFNRTVYPAKFTRNSQGAAESGTISSGSVVHLDTGEEVAILEIPADTKYEIRKKMGLLNTAPGNVVMGLTIEGENIVSFTNILKGYVLPKTGGPGISLYMFSGIALMGSVLLIHEIRRKSKRKGVR